MEARALFFIYQVVFAVKIGPDVVNNYYISRGTSRSKTTKRWSKTYTLPVTLCTDEISTQN